MPPNSESRRLTEGFLEKVPADCYLDSEQELDMWKELRSSGQGREFSAAQPKGKRELEEAKYYRIVAVRRQILSNSQNNV